MISPSPEEKKAKITNIAITIHTPYNITAESLVFFK